MPKSKPWGRPKRGRAATASRRRRRFLIVCEDAKSSRYYFESFPINQRYVEISVLGTGMNTDTLVQEAIRKKEQADDSRQPYANIWCVFDRDSFPQANYARAFQLAESKNIKVAWANEAFELWYVLHFCYFDSAIGRGDYARKLLEHGLQYDRAIYEKLKHLQEAALKNAAKLEKLWNESGKHYPERENPSTGVHKLVERLNELAALGKLD
jgi:hypothetical protein